MNHTATRRAAPGTETLAASSEYIAEELRRYDEHLHDLRGLAACTRKTRLRVVGLLLRQHFGERPIRIERLRPDDIRQFLAIQSGGRRSASHASQLAVALRSYLRYRSTRGDDVGCLAAVISNPVHWRLASLPRALKPEDVERLLNGSTTGLRWPKREHAILRCALDMGLRAGEIAHLMIGDIDWRAGTVTLRGTKSLRQDLLPLPLETGQALADYLQHERPATRSPAIFVRQTGGLDRPISAMAVVKVIKRACRRLGLQASAHALRHTLACRLVEKGSSLKEVADLLRHRSLSTTLIYAKLDTPKLSTVPLPWPGSKS
jgi:site-specific recombinase XerD